MYIYVCMRIYALVGLKLTGWVEFKILIFV